MEPFEQPYDGHPKIMDAIVLAGGLGTRLRSALPGLPKALAPVGGRPFLELLLDRLEQCEVRRVVLSLGYRARMIRDHFGARYGAIDLAYAVESSPLGTGGATRAALPMTASNPVLVVNGDTLCDIDYAAMLSQHCKNRAAISIAITTVPDCARFGRVIIRRNRVVGFAEKGEPGKGSISVGTYLLNRNIFAGFRLREAFSIEKDFFTSAIESLRPHAFATSGYFVDIGVPEDLIRAQAAPF